MNLFALFLVLYEFTTYSANDMIMPGMIQVVNYFNAPEYFVALSFSAYILGNCIFLIIAGFFAERFGKRKIMLTGNFLFLFFTFAIIFSTSIHEFIAYRFFQGSGLAIIAIGYALIHEHFSDKAAIKIIALMGNITILAPLIGPAIGSLIMSFFNWQTIFILTGVLSAISLVGLFRYIPKDHTLNVTLNFFQVVKQYALITKNKEFLKGMLSSVLIIMPLVIWIGQAPNIILHKLQLNYVHYAIYQIICVGGLMISSIIMQFIAGQYRIFSIVRVGNYLLLLGLIILLLGSKYIEWIAAGMFIYSLGMGLANGCIWRLIMTIKGYSHSMLSVMLGFYQMLLFFIGIMITNEFISFYHFALWSFTTSCALFGVMGFLLIIFYMKNYKNREWL